MLACNAFEMDLPNFQAFFESDRWKRWPISNPSYEARNSAGCADVDGGQPQRGELVRLLPQWYADAGPISLYYASRTLPPVKTRVFVDFVTDTFRRERMAERFAGSTG